MDDIVIEADIPQPEKRALISVSELLRYLGTLVLLSSPAVFMLQQWEQMNHITRYFSFLGLTGLIAATGFFCALKLRENKGARTLLAITAAIVPVHFLQLGALIYSKTADHIPSMPHYLIWTAPSTSSLITVLALALVGLLPITYVAFCTLARQKSAAITAIYLLACAQLLIPVRDPVSVAIVAAFTFTLLFVGYIYSLERAACMRTFEGVLCRIMLCLPISFLIGRQLYLYNADDTFRGVVSAVLAVVFFHLIPRTIEDRSNSLLSQLIGTIFALSATNLLVTSSLHSFGLTQLLPHLLSLLPFAAVFYGLSFSINYLKQGYRSIAIVLAVAGVIQEVLFSSNLLALSLCLVLSMVVIVAAFAQQGKYTFGAGILCFTVTLVRFIQYAVPFASISPWVGLAILGLVTVVLGSYVEQDNNRLKMLYVLTKNRFRIS